MNMVTRRKPKGMAAWLAQERVFRLLPCIAVEGLFIALMAIRLWVEAGKV